MAELLTGTTFSVGGTANTFNLLSLDGPSESRAAVDVSTCATTTRRVFVPGDLYDPGTCDIEYEFVPTGASIISGAAATVIITFPSGAGSQTWTFTAFCTDSGISGALEEMITATMTMKINSAITGPS